MGVNIRSLLRGLPPYIYKREGKYEAMKKDGRKLIYVGRYDTLEEAITNQKT
jgi:hypothetical protein